MFKLVMLILVFIIYSMPGTSKTLPKFLYQFINPGCAGDGGY